MNKPSVEIIPIPALRDNYIWLLKAHDEGMVVDPGCAKSVLSAINSYQFKLSTILITHHHVDHVGGVGELLTAFPNIKVYAPYFKAYDFPYTLVDGASTLELFHIMVKVIAVPGHTLNHVVYYLSTIDTLFCGDTLFGAGCGRVFEGTMAQMWQSLQTINALPAQTKVYCGHEYTLANLKFAHELEPNNQAIVQRMIHTQKQREQYKPSVPSSLALERETNPFLRCHSPELQENIGSSGLDEVAVFSAVRKRKDCY